MKAIAISIFVLDILVGTVLIVTDPVLGPSFNKRANIFTTHSHLPSPAPSNPPHLEVSSLYKLDSNLKVGNNFAHSSK